MKDKFSEATGFLYIDWWARILLNISFISYSVVGNQSIEIGNYLHELLHFRHIRHFLGKIRFGAWIKLHHHLNTSKLKSSKSSSLRNILISLEP